MRIFINRKILFISLTSLLLIADTLFVLINYRSDRSNLEAMLAQEGQELHNAYQVAYSMTLTNMQQLATFVAGDPRIQRTFAEATQAVEAEGGGAGGQRTAELRQKLYEIIGPGWQRMTREYQVRQLHFHLAPGSTSFLRVHKPEKFGDNMDNLRHMVVDVNSDQQPRSGLELGRVYSGIRSIVPVYDLADSPRHIGALEVGTSFSLMIRSLTESIGADVAVLLAEQRVEDATWNRPKEAMTTDCGCFIEASSSAELIDLLKAEGYRSPELAISSPDQNQLISIGDKHYAITEFPLQDYVGLRDGSEKPVGRIIIWRPADNEITGLRQDTLKNIIYSIVGFLLIELLLYLGIRITLRHQEAEVDRRTREVRLLNTKLEEIAHQDYLTGVHSRRYFIERLTKECSRADREKTAVSLLMIDVDYFKRINDTWGHPAGDEVLASLGTLLQESCRNYDLVGRYGGEEFCMMMPGMQAEDAVKRAEKLRLKVSETIRVPGDNAPHPTVSIGVSTHIQGQDHKKLIAAADEALYEAKGQGRNRVILADSTDPLAKTRSC
ncbi:diguanylate cyclase [Marinobacterium sp. YM272]|uniref:sensor domain-containing diguanylate cyclase n=1 Tax=Marinobacterium sp. YM272 TaxID=3421654 RepID=UPI003D7F6DC7